MVTVHTPEDSEAATRLRPEAGAVADEPILPTAVAIPCTSDDERRCVRREFEVTVVTTRSGTTVVRVAASDRESALSSVREELASGDFTTPADQCTDDVQTEIWTIRERS